MNDSINIGKLDSSATFSVCRNYRYGLWRRWGEPTGYVLFIGLNPSTADEKEDDPTIRRCKQFAKDWGYSSMAMANLFALRATKPKEMMAHKSPVGIDNDGHLKHLAKYAGIIVCAWGANGDHLERDKKVTSLLKKYELKCLGVTKSGQPGHPLYLKADTKLRPFDVS